MEVQKENEQLVQEKLDAEFDVNEVMKKEFKKNFKKLIQFQSQESKSDSMII